MHTSAPSAASRSAPRVMLPSRAFLDPALLDVGAKQHHSRQPTNAREIPDRLLAGSSGWRYEQVEYQIHLISFKSNQLKNSLQQVIEKEAAVASVAARRRFDLALSHFVPSHDGLLSRPQAGLRRASGALRHSFLLPWLRRRFVGVQGVHQNSNCNSSGQFFRAGLVVFRRRVGVVPLGARISRCARCARHPDGC